MAQIVPRSERAFAACARSVTAASGTLDDRARPWPSLDHADEPRLVAAAAHRVERGGTSVTGDDREHPEPEVEDVLHLVVANVAGRLDHAEDARLLPSAPLHDRVAVVREAPAARFPAMPPPVTWHERVHLGVASELRAPPARR